ncbi:MAG TPA: hypothetical protein VIF60_17465 [Burkholderiaceae bacterium]|jgi:hypothetical protein
MSIVKCLLSLSAFLLAAIANATPPPIPQEALGKAPYIVSGTVVKVLRQEVEIDECRSATDTVLVVRRASAKGEVVDIGGKGLDFLRAVNFHWTCPDRPSPVGGMFGVYGLDELHEGAKVTIYASDIMGWTRNIISPNGLVW